MQQELALWNPLDHFSDQPQLGISPGTSYQILFQGFCQRDGFGKMPGPTEGNFWLEGRGVLNDFWQVRTRTQDIPPTQTLLAVTSCAQGTSWLSNGSQVTSDTIICLRLSCGNLQTVSSLHPTLRTQIRVETLGGCGLANRHCQPRALHLGLGTLRYKGYLAKAAKRSGNPVDFGGNSRRHGNRGCSHELVTTPPLSAGDNTAVVCAHEPAPIDS